MYKSNGMKIDFSSSNQRKRDGVGIKNRENTLLLKKERNGKSLLNIEHRAIQHFLADKNMERERQRKRENEDKSK